MDLKLYNTASRQKEVFKPLDPKDVRMYVCGPTVYDFAHIGNARPVIVFDVLFRVLRHIYGAEGVRYVRNITDVDDKINARAAERGIDIRTLTEETYANFKADVAALGCLPPSVEPRATEHIAPMITMIRTLIETGHAYAAEGHVLYDVSSKADYGKLARRSLDEMIAGARVDVAPYKKSPMDFVLWKPSTPELPGWDSPWGRGRPGWHIECSAMSEKHLGESFDIHGGGIDLVFPHHENEIAQSEGAHGGKPLAKIWMHNGFLQVEGEKMSKSLGNFVTIRELLTGWRAQAWSGDVLRLAMLSTHYTQPINWAFRLLDETKQELARWVAVIRKFGLQRDLPGNPSTELLDALRDDLNTPEMFKVLRSFHKEASRGSQSAARSLYFDLMFIGALKPKLTEAYIQGVSGSQIADKELLDNFGLGTQLKIALLNGDDVFRRRIEEQLKQRNLRASYSDEGGVLLDHIKPRADEDDEVRRLIDARNAARKAKDFKEADRIRDELLAQGIVLKDGPDGTTWELKR